MKKTALLLAWSLLASSVLAETPSTPRFNVYEFVVQGNSVLPAAMVEKTLAPFLGPDKTFKDIEAARAALEKLYQDAGYLSVVVSLPDQKIQNDEVRFDVVEAQVDRLKVTGAQYALPSGIKAKVPSLAPGQTPYFPHVQEELAKAQSGDVQVTPLIGAGDEADKLHVELKVEDKPAVHGSIEANSKQSFNTRRGRIESVLSYTNLWQKGHTAALSWQYAPTRPSDANTLTFIYGLPLAEADDLTFSLTDSRSDTPTNTSLGGATLTRGRFYGVRWQHQLDALNWPVRHSTFVALDYKDNHDSNLDVGGFTTSKPPLRYPVVSVGYNLFWQASPQTSWQANTSVATSNRSLAGRTVECEGRGEMDQFECKRAGSSPDFMVWKAGLGVQTEIIGKWQLNAKADAQLASGPLASGEQYSLGGMDTIRGYYEYEQAGDMGWSSRFELVTPAWAPFGEWRTTGLAFYDRGFILLKNPAASQHGHVHMAGTGLGWRADNGHGLQLSLNAALPLIETDRAAQAGGFETASKRRVHWDLVLRQAF
ncbi:MAG: ShlB/FhaC/HecB family hemolysin secretion/activation protein [Burkholderiales bacterium]|nr:ShlB/FhaC/HecB family hemolysin secretion/activation protein [Burkholderiales bacterium]